MQWIFCQIIVEFRKHESDNLFLLYVSDRKLNFYFLLDPVVCPSYVPFFCCFRWLLSFRSQVKGVLTSVTTTTMTMTKQLLTLVALAVSVSTVGAAGAVELTKENFSELTKGKNSFVKFLAPWYVQFYVSTMKNKHAMECAVLFKKKLLVRFRFLFVHFSFTCFRCCVAMTSFFRFFWKLTLWCD